MSTDDQNLKNCWGLTLNLPVSDFSTLLQRGGGPHTTNRLLSSFLPANVSAILASSMYPTNPFHPSLIELSTEKKHLKVGFSLVKASSYSFTKISSSVLLAKSRVRSGLSVVFSASVTYWMIW